jgi:hypothetical protein
MVEWVVEAAVPRSLLMGPCAHGWNERAMTIPLAFSLKEALPAQPTALQ